MAGTSFYEELLDRLRTRTLEALGRQPLSLSHPDDTAGASEPPALESWPPLHVPHDRRLLLRMRGWQLRAHEPSDPRHEALGLPGILHLQLWHPEARVSVLTPCLLTRERLEVFPIEGRRRRLTSYWELRDLLAKHHGLDAPSPPVLSAAIRWFVVRAERAHPRAERTLLPSLRAATSYPPIEGLMDQAALPVEGASHPPDRRFERSEVVTDDLN